MWWGLNVGWRLRQRQPSVLNHIISFSFGAYRKIAFLNPFASVWGQKTTYGQWLWRQDLAPKHLIKSPLLSLLLEWIQRSLPLQITAPIIYVIQGDVARRTTWPEMSTLNYGIEQMNLYCLKTLRFYCCFFLCYPILTNIPLLYGLFNDAHLLGLYTFYSRVANYDIPPKFLKVYIDFSCTNMNMWPKNRFLDITEF